ncbi:MAG: AraC family ligand binding domain-containing protein [Clostridia bacterium]|nr:AraC family ligand binding domain-containing protein [Clostridia bacterium]
MNCVEFFRQKGISLVWAMRYSPCERKKNVSGRQYNSFMYMESGRYLLTFADGELQIEAGDLIFFPKGSVHSSELISDDADCIQVEFEITVPVPAASAVQAGISSDPRSVPEQSADGQGKIHAALRLCQHQRNRAGAGL